MSSDEIAIRANNLSKCYQIYDRPQDRLKQSIVPRLQRLVGRSPKPYFREFWALKDLSFEVRKGETVGIIGRNGSGKSTLLQMICGTLTPTTGSVEVNGRVAALLELGAGFNPEFTGRENVYMNGAVLGLSKEEIDERFEDIVAFADIGEFIEQPVKTYSSGMFVRLAFAVQACVEPDVFIVDEALAVGDIFFRQKCYQRLETLRSNGTSILLVTHAMLDVEQFCQRAILLDHGQEIFQGSASEAVKRYYLVEQQNRFSPEKAVTPAPVASCESDFGTIKEGFFWPEPDAFLDISAISQVSNGWARCTGIALCDKNGRPCKVFQQGETASFFYEFELLRDIEVPIGGIVIANDKGIIVHGKSTLEYGSDVPKWVKKLSRLRFRQDIDLAIGCGEYTFTVGLATIDDVNYSLRSEYSHQDLTTKILRLCHLPNMEIFTVFPRKNGAPVQLLHHGMADLPGKCHVLTTEANSSDVRWEAPMVEETDGSI
ncbi:ABC transporter ATP-binding protein [Methylocaldum sp.]|uniref:ABC transporter ATP-binding protein n=1 Tax=Methylocaldum sp. TaxID=1969727 RepID=UPI002D5E3DA2|nr:ABC transporter ATP-binding protein [Methylocaldum sp.]HYE37782.1 ABC transporter ATP-binding protein [Methylocaldum sp.]